MTAASSSSFESPRAATQVRETGPGPAPPEAAGPPLIEVSNLGVCYRLHKRRKQSHKEMLLSGRLRSKAPLLWALRGICFACHTIRSISPDQGSGKPPEVPGHRLAIIQVFSCDLNNKMILGPQLRPYLPIPVVCLCVAVNMLG